MELTSIGARQDKGTRTHFTESDTTRTPTVVRGNPPCVRVWVHGDRRYRLTLTPCDIIRFLLHLPPSALAAAVAEVGDEVDMAEQLPEVLKQLTAGAMTPAR